MDKITNVTQENQNLEAAATGVRPEDLLPELELTVNGARTNYCTPQGAVVRSYTGSFLVPMKDAKNARVELPHHRWFFQAVRNVSKTVKNKTHYDTVWKQVTGSIVLPVITRHDQLLSTNGFPPTGANPVKPGTIAEVSHSWIGRNTKHRKKGDIRLKEGNYLYVAELCMYQGSEVLTISHNEKGHSLLFKSNDLPIRYSSLEQEFYRTEQTATPDMIKYKGIGVLKQAALITSNMKRKR